MVERPCAGSVEEEEAAAAAVEEGNEVGVAGRGGKLHVVVVVEVLVGPEDDHGVAVELPITLGMDCGGFGKVGGGTLPPVDKVGVT